MSHLEPTIRHRHLGPAALVAALLAVLALALTAQPAAASSVLPKTLAEEWANTYGYEQCKLDKPDCDDGWAGRCRQEGRFQVTCYAYKHYEIEPRKEFRELWICQRRVRYKAEKRAFYNHRRLVTHRQVLGDWTCGGHHKVNDDWFGPEEEYEF